MCSCHICHTKIAASPLHPLEHNALLHRNKSPILADFRYIYVKVFLPEDRLMSLEMRKMQQNAVLFLNVFHFHTRIEKITSTNSAAILTVGRTIYDKKQLMSCF